MQHFIMQQINNRFQYRSLAFEELSLICCLFQDEHYASDEVSVHMDGTGE